MKVKQSCKIMQMRLTWSKCNPTIMYGFAASLCTASRKSTWPMSGKITVKRDKPCLRWWLHTLLTWCAKCRHLYCRVNATKGYERGQRLLPHRWWCLLVEVPGLRQTGWSSVTSARTETPPSRDCVPSGHVTPVMVIKVMIKKKSIVSTKCQRSFITNITYCRYMLHSNVRDGTLPRLCPVWEHQASLLGCWATLQCFLDH